MQSDELNFFLFAGFGFFLACRRFQGDFAAFQVERVSRTIKRITKI